MAQVIALLTAPVLTRLYSPDQFGLLSVYMSVVAIVGAAATLRYEMVIPLPKRDGLAAHALALSLACVVVIAALSGVVLLAFPEAIASWLGYERLPAFSFLVPVGVLAIGTYTALSNWAVRQRAFPVIARTKLFQAISQSVIQIGSAFTPFATFGLVLGNLLGQSAGIGSFIRIFSRRDRAAFVGLDWGRAKFLALHYWRFPAFSLPASVAFSASQYLPALILFSQFGAASSGFYLLAQRVGMMPASVLGTAISQSIYKNLADHRKSREAVGRAARVPVTIMAALTIGPAAFAAVFAPLIVEVAFGPEWVEAGHYLRWMVPWVCATVIFGAMTPIVAVLGFQKLGLAFQLGSLAASLLAMSVAGAMWGSVGAVAGFALTKAGSIVLYRLHMFHLIVINPFRIALSMSLQALVFVLIFVITKEIVGYGVFSELVYVVPILTGAALIYAIFVWTALRASRLSVEN